MSATSTAHLALTASAVELAATAGGHANVRLVLHNRSSHVDRVWIDVAGASSEWTGLYPDSLSLPPRTARVAWLAVQPPADTAGGEVCLAVRVRSAIDAAVELDQTVTVLVAPAADAA